MQSPPEWLVGGYRFQAEDVEGRRFQGLLLEGDQEFGLVQEGAATDVDQVAARLHGGQDVGVDQPTGGIGERGHEHHMVRPSDVERKVRARYDLPEVGIRRPFGPPCPPDLHTDGAEQTSGLAPDRRGAHDQRGRPCDVAKAPPPLG
jgi:hypothetical protein